MRPEPVRIAYTLAALIAAAWLVLWAVGAASGDEAGKRARTEMHERNMAIVARAYASSRGKTDTVVRYVTRQGARVDAAVADVRPALDEAKVALADSGATIERLRGTLGRLTVRTEELVAQVVIYRATVDTLTIALAMERAAATELHAADQRVIASLKAERCRITVLFWKVGCPTRTQSAVGGGLAVAAALVVLR